MTAVMQRPAPTRRRSRRWLRLVIPYAVVLSLLLVSVIGYVVEEPDQTDRAYLSPVSSADVGSSELQRLLRERGIRIERHTSTADALRSAHRGDATLFVTTPDLLHSFYLRMLKLMPASTPVVLVHPADDTLGRGLLPAGVADHRWASTTAAPGCGYRAATEAGRAGVLRTRYAAFEAPLDRCYEGSLLRVRHRSTTLTLVGSADPFRNDRIGEHGNARLAVGLLVEKPRVVWLDLHGEEAGPRVLEGTGLDESPAPADLGRGSPDPDFPVPDPDGTDPGEPEPGVPPAADGDDGGPSTFDLFPATAWTVLALIALAAVLAAAARARRLGAPVPEPLPVLVPTTETVTGRGRLYQRSRDRGAALAVLRRAARDRITHALDLPPDADRDTLSSALTPQTGVELLFEPDPETDEDLVQLAAALEVLVETVTRIPEGETRD